MNILLNITKIILNANKIKIRYSELKKIENNSDLYFEYLFKSFSQEELNKFLSSAICTDLFAPIFINNLNYLLTHANQNVLNNIILYLKKNGFSDELILNSIKNNAENQEIYLRQLRFTKNKIEEYKKIFENENNNLYCLYDKLESNIYDKCAFETNIIYPQSYFNVNEYLNYILKNLHLNIDDFEYLPNGRGNFGWCFKNGDIVLKLASRNAVWEIPMHYRINDFIIRKQFGKLILTITPYGDTDAVTNQDIENVLFDFEKAGIKLNDKNYRDNFALVEYEIPETMFRDVDGIRCYVDTFHSKEYEKKKVKLIDQDYLYLKKDKKMKQGILGEKWK